MKRGEVWLVNLEPTLGAEIRKARPCVILSPDEMQTLKTVIVAPLTSHGFLAPTRVGTAFGGRDGTIVLDELRALDKRRLIRNLGSLAADELIMALGVLVEMFGK